jgi:hypothetical protein
MKTTIEAMSAVAFFSMWPGLMLAFFMRFVLREPKRVVLGVVPLCSIGCLLAVWFCISLNLSSPVYMLMCGISGIVARRLSHVMFAKKATAL